MSSDDESSDSSQLMSWTDHVKADPGLAGAASILCFQELLKTREPTTWVLGAPAPAPATGSDMFQGFLSGQLQPLLQDLRDNPWRYDEAQLDLLRDLETGKKTSRGLDKEERESLNKITALFLLQEKKPEEPKPKALPVDEDEEDFMPEPEPALNPYWWMG